MAATRLAADSGERSFRHDPRMRQALARLGRDGSPDGPAGSSLYWLLRSRRPKFAALTGQISQADLLVIACALADCRAKLVAETQDHAQARATLAAAGLDWVLRSDDCLPCLRQVRPCDCLIVGAGAPALGHWSERLGRNALLLGLARTPATATKLAEQILNAGFADEIARLRDGRRCLLIADHDPRGPSGM